MNGLQKCEIFPSYTNSTDLALKIKKISVIETFIVY
jgi:hypothetical protein